MRNPVDVLIAQSAVNEPGEVVMVPRPAPKASAAKSEEPDPHELERAEGEGMVARAEGEYGGL